jgi:hypothetical protein
MSFLGSDPIFKHADLGLVMLSLAEYLPGPGLELLVCFQGAPSVTF